MSFVLPSQGFVFWPVACGDSSTIIANEQAILQIDLNHMASCADRECPTAPVVDQLVEFLPRVGGKPYLAVFALTHPDQDHCRGFTDLLKRVKIGELWLTPRTFWEYKKDLCEDAKAFCDEATRRARETIRRPGSVASGHRVRIIGYDDLLQTDEYRGFPRNRLTVPGSVITELDGVNCSGGFRAFVHAPFKDDAAGERNNTSLALQITLNGGGTPGRTLFLGDLSYPVLDRIFRVSATEDVAWNVLLSPHHCSKLAMYWAEDGEEETLRQHLLDRFETAQVDPGYIVASSLPIPVSNKPGDNPPHAKAKARYLEIVQTAFLCTQEHPDAEAPVPIVFEVGPSGLVYRAPAATRTESASRLGRAIVAARGSGEPPKDRVGFGRPA